MQRSVLTFLSYGFIVKLRNSAHKAIYTVLVKVRCLDPEPTQGTTLTVLIFANSVHAKILTPRNVWKRSSVVMVQH